MVGEGVGGLGAGPVVHRTRVAFAAAGGGGGVCDQRSRSNYGRTGIEMNAHMGDVLTYVA